MNDLTNPFIEHFRDRMLSFPELFDEYRWDNYFMLEPHLNNFDDICLSILGVLCFVSFGVTWFFSSHFFLALALSSLISLCFVAFLGWLSYRWERKRDQKWSELYDQFTEDDFKWVAKTLRDFSDRPEFHGLYDNQDKTLEDLAHLVNVVLFDLAKLTLSGTAKDKKDILKFVLTPLNRHQIAAAHEGKEVSPRIISDRTLSSRLIDCMIKAQKARARLKETKQLQTEDQQIEDLLYSL